MTTGNFENSKSGWFGEWPRAMVLCIRRYEALLPPVLFALLVTAVSHWWIAYQFNHDEGLNLMKGALVANGFSLYSEIWNDQPPLLTFVLAGVKRIFPANVTASRAVTLAFSGLLLWSLFRIICRLEGRACAWLAIAALASVQLFQMLSVSVMIGLPATALAVAALEQVLAGGSDEKDWHYWLAGALFAMSLQTKLFTGILFPTLVLATFVRVDSGGQLTSWQMRVPKLAPLLVSAIVVFVTIAALTGEAIFSQLIMPHHRASGVYDLSRLDGLSLLGVQLIARTPEFVLILFALGFLVIVGAMRPTRLIPVVWFTSAFLVLGLHRPFQYHHLVLLYPPLAWIAGLSINLVREPTSRSVVTIACILFVVSLGASAALKQRAENEAQAKLGQTRFPALLQEASADAWVVTDELIDAYRAGRLVPPELAVWSGKRIEGGYLPADYLIAVVQKRQPERILLRRFEQWQLFLDYLRSTYIDMSTQGQDEPLVYVRSRNQTVAQETEPAVVKALVTATEALRMHSANGGFAGHYDLATAKMWGRSPEQELMNASSILVRPRGATQQAGQCFLRGYRVTGQKLFWDAATDAGRALACAQGQHGGWAAVAHFNQSCGARPGGKAGEPDAVATLDDGASQSALWFLMDLATVYATKPHPLPAWLTESIQRGLDFLLLAQHDGGGWPQSYPSRGKGYGDYDTLNDGAISEAIATLLRAYRILGDGRYLAAAIRGGDFLIEVQGPPTQPAWAQQYDSASRPAAARAFEPAAYGSEETGFAMNALFDLYTVTGDQRLVAGLGAARAWLERSTIRPNTWARLYEIGTNRPIYGDRDGKVHYSLDEISSERRYGYRWEAEFPSVTRALSRYDVFLKGGIEGLTRYPEEEKRREEQKYYSEAVPLVPAIIATTRPMRGWVEEGVLSTQTFVTNCKTLLDSVEFATATQ